MTIKQPVPISVTNTCARCSHPFTSKPDGFVDEALENEIAAHQERCLIVGDWLRFEHGKRWIEGPVTTLFNAMGHAEIRTERQSGMEYYTESGRYSFNWPDRVGSLRRILRPGQDVRFAKTAGKPEDCANCGEHIRNHYGGTEYRCSPKSLVESACADHTAVAKSPAPTLYDGVPLALLLEKDETQRRETWDGYRFTPSQRAAISAHWSAQLRAKIAASAEAERLTVRVDLQEDE